MRIAIAGSRGVPGNYGGFETCAEELGARLAARGHEVTVYCCKPYSSTTGTTWRGMRRVVLPTVRTKSLEKLVFAILSVFHAAFTRADVVLMLGVSASAFCFIPRLLGKRVVINVDGLEWQRKKWGPIASRYLRFSEWAACRTTDRVITDALCVQDYYRQHYRRETTFIPYGIKDMIVESDQALRDNGVSRQDYVLYVSRFDPENNPLLVRQAFERVGGERKLVMVGAAPYAQRYVEQVRDTSDRRIVFAGAIYGTGYRELQTHALAYVQATEVGGVHPALVEAVGCGHCIIANDVPEHREVLGDAALYYDGTIAGLAQKLQLVIDSPALVEEMRSKARALVARYSWDRIAEEYEDCFRKAIERSFATGADTAGWMPAKGMPVDGMPTGLHAELHGGRAQREWA